MNAEIEIVTIDEADFMSVFYSIEDEDERDEYRLDRSQHN
jgi:hypothetical protein